VANWKTPQLVITGEQDFRSPYTQTIAAFTALQTRNVPSQLLVFPDEGHVVSKPQNNLQWYTEVFGWMDRWMCSTTRTTSTNIVEQKARLGRHRTRTFAERFLGAAIWPHR